MRHRVLIVSTLLLALLPGCAQRAPQAVAPPAVAAAPATTQARSDTGELDGAPYRIDLPADWNGSVVLLLHGYEPVGAQRQSPWPRNPATQVLLDQGYAVAASGYRSQGWAVAEAITDTTALRAHFVARFGAPRHSYLAGFSMGGHIALALLEAQPGSYDGALSLCGVNTPAAGIFTDGLLMPLLAFDHQFPGVLGVPDGDLFAADAPAMLDGDAVHAALLAEPARAAALGQRLQIRPQELAGALWLQYVVLRELASRAGGIPVDNQHTVYSGFADDAAFNRSVRRYAGAPDAMAYARANARLTGQVARPVVLQSNAIDPTVPPRFAQDYPKLAAAQGSSAWVADLPPVGEGHCAFDGAQIGSAFRALTGWVERGRRP